MWQEDDSQVFLRYGSLFVPRREEQLETVCRLVPAEPDEEFNAAELGAGDGALATIMLSSFPNCSYLALDGSDLMRERLEVLPESRAGRLRVADFDLADSQWPALLPSPLRCVLASLIVHHLDGVDAKKRLFSSVASRLEPGGAFLIVDLVEPISPYPRNVYVRQWDEGVRARIEQSGEGTEAYDIFREHRWNFYEDPNPDPYDKPSPLPDQLNWLRERVSAR